MALPNQIDKGAPANSALLSLGAGQIRDFKLFIEDVFGIPDVTNISNALTEVTSTGLKNIRFQNAAANPTVAGALQRNAANLLWHDGTAARTLVTSASGAVAVAGIIAGDGSGDFTISSTAAYTTLLSASVTIPTGAKFALMAASFWIKATGTSASADNVRLSAAGTASGQCFFTGPGDPGGMGFTLYGAVSNPTAGVQTIALQWRWNGASTLTMTNPNAEDLGNVRPRMLYAVTM